MNTRSIRSKRVCIAATKSYTKRKHVGDKGELRRPKKKARVHDIPYLASNIIQNILAKLPVKSIFRCQLVCHEWRDIIKHPSFAELHYQNSHTAFIGFSKVEGTSKNLMTTERYHGMKGLKLQPLDTFTCFDSDFEAVNSCRGFLLFKNNLQSQLHVYNPLTKEKLTFSTNQSIPELVCGLGFSPTTQQYKLVSWSKHGGIYNIQVTTLGSCESTISVRAPESILDKIHAPNNNPVALNGNIHWLATGAHIARFDLDHEELSLMASPRIGDYPMRIVGIGTLHGCLCMMIIDIGNIRHGIETWVMKEYGNTKSWTQCCVVRNLESGIQRMGLFNCKGMESGEEGKILILTPSGRQLIYDLRRNECLNRRQGVRGFDQEQGIQLHCFGFFSLSQSPMQPHKSQPPAC